MVSMSNGLHSPIANLRQLLITRLKKSLADSHLSGAVAQHILRADPTNPMVLGADYTTDEWIIGHPESVYTLPLLSATGYHLALPEMTKSQAAINNFRAGYDRLRQRQPFPSDAISFANWPLAFAGIVMGVKYCLQAEEREKELKWLSGILSDRRKRGTLTGMQDLLYGYVSYLITGQHITTLDLDHYPTLSEKALIYWAIRVGAAQPISALLQDSALQIAFLNDLLLETDLSTIDDEHTPYLLCALDLIVIGEIGSIVLTRSFISTLLRRLEPAFRRWRWDDPGKVRDAIQWPIHLEREVQDIVWLILRPYFDDLVDEEKLPRFGLKSYNPDFGIPSLRTLIEVKMVRSVGQFKDIQDEIMTDSVGYLQSTDKYDKIVVLIYDDTVSVQQHDEIARALCKLDSIEDVVIICRPSQLPPSAEQLSPVR